MKSKSTQKKDTQPLPLSSPFFIIIFSCLVAQFLNHYYAVQFRTGGHFYYGYLVTCFGIPLIVTLLLKIPFSQLGLGLPAIDRKTGKILLILFIALLVLFISARVFQFFIFHEYTDKFIALDSKKFSQFINFTFFTLSTLPSWEFLHRAFLLFGIIYALSEQTEIPEDHIQKIAITIVWIFEVMFHLVKPQYETLGMLVGSPVLSYLAIKSRSVWTAFILHLYVELLFIAAIIFR